MRKSLSNVIAGVAVAALAVPVLAGGFGIALGNPEANPKAKAQNAVLTFKPVGCHEPEKAAVAATAIGLVKGERRSVELKPIALDEQGLYAVTRQWPAEGRWVVQVVAKDQGRVTHALIPMGPDGANRGKAKYAAGMPDAETVAALLADGSEADIARK